MIIADLEKVEISFPNTPAFKALYSVDSELLERSVIQVDLSHIFCAIATKYDVPTCADIIQQSLTAMMKDMGLEGEQNED